MTRSEPDEVVIVHRDEHLLVLAKPAGLLTTSDRAGQDCLVERAHALDPNAPRLHPSSRLDRDVSGLVIFARDRTATQYLIAARRAGTYFRRYVGLVVGLPEVPSGTWNAAIGIDANDPRHRLANAGLAPRQASTRYAIVRSAHGVSEIDLFPETGRTHQLRVHTAHAGLPLFGDVHYGGPRRIARADGRMISAPRPMLHCAEVRVPFPRRSCDFSVPVPDDFRRVRDSLFPQ